jgi:uncharacterized protein YegL
MNDTSMIADAPIPGAEFYENTNQRTPCVLVLDGSGSMADNGKIDQLNRGLQVFETALKEDKSARTRVQVLVIRLGDNDDVEVLSDWGDAISFSAPAVQANGRTPLGKAVDLALRKIEEQKGVYKANSIPYTRPWLFLMSDGEPTDRDWEAAADRCRQAEQEKKVVVWPIGVEGADVAKLGRFNQPGSAVHTLSAANFRDLFVWLSGSLAKVTQSQPGQAVQIAAPPTMTVPT